MHMIACCCGNSFLVSAPRPDTNLKQTLERDGPQWSKLQQWVTQELGARIKAPDPSSGQDKK